MGSKHESWAGVFIQPLAHQFINAVDPAWNKIRGHILVPFLQHLTNFPKPVLVDWWIDVCVFEMLKN